MLDDQKPIVSLLKPFSFSVYPSDDVVFLWFYASICMTAQSLFEWHTVYIYSLKIDFLLKMVFFLSLQTVVIGSNLSGLKIGIVFHKRVLSRKISVKTC